MVDISRLQNDLGTTARITSEAADLGNPVYIRTLEVVTPLDLSSATPLTGDSLLVQMRGSSDIEYRANIEISDKDTERACRIFTALEPVACLHGRLWGSSPLSRSLTVVSISIARFREADWSRDMRG